MKVAGERGQRLLAGSAERSNFDIVKVRASERDASLLAISQRAKPKFDEVKDESLSTQLLTPNS